jgi:hypothetical protein
MRRIKLGLALLILAIAVTPGIHVFENTFMMAEAAPGNWVPKSSSMITFACVSYDASGNGDSIYCRYGHDWTNYYARCADADAQCIAGFKSYSKSAARRCPEFLPHDPRSWCVPEKR